MPSTKKHAINHLSALKAVLCSTKSPKGKHKYNSKYMKVVQQTLWFGSSEEQVNQVLR